MDWRGHGPGDGGGRHEFSWRALGGTRDFSTTSVSSGGVLAHFSGKGRWIRNSASPEDYEALGRGTGGGGSSWSDATKGRILVGRRNGVGFDRFGSTSIWAFGRDGV